jgi:RNA polymerase sigma-70 factor (ECF subfamily)
MAISIQALRTQVAIIAVTAEETVEFMVREHSGLVFRVAYSVLRDHHDAEDATQETFLRVLKHRSELSRIKETRSWLARIAFRIALNRYNSRRREPQNPVEGMERLQASIIPPEEIIHCNEVKALIETFIAALPADLRNVLRLSTVEELNSREIGAILEIPENSVRTRLHRARQQLKEKMGARLGKTYG